jgi:hypothetical protein
MAKMLTSRAGAALLAVSLLWACDAPATTPAVAPVVEAPAPTEPTAPPRAPYASFDQIAYADGLNLYGLRMGSLSIILGRTTLREVQTAIGIGELASNGEGATWLCYTIPNAQRVWLTSSEMSSGEFVTGVRAIVDAEATANIQCPTLPANFRNIALDPDLWLGAPLSQVERRYGAATAYDNWRHYLHDTSRRSDPRLDQTDSHALAVRIDGERVVALEAERLVTN